MKKKPGNESKDVLETLIQLSKEFPWLLSRSEQFIELYTNFCTNNAEKNLIVELIRRFYYLEDSEFSNSIKYLVEDIVTTPGLVDSETMIVSMTADEGSDSGQFVLYFMKPFFEMYGWRKHITVNTFGKTYRTYKAYKDKRPIKNIVIIDEFIGSGKTAFDRYKSIKINFDNNNIPMKFYIKTVASTNKGLNFLIKNELNVAAQIVLPKGITDFDSEKVRRANLKRMYKLEEYLSKSYEDRPLPRMGYAQCEALYSRENGNTPNNVFPIFWWPFISSGKNRRTLFIRAMGDA